MEETNPDDAPSRRSVLRRTGALLTSGLAVTETAAGRSAADAHLGFTAGTEHDEGSTFTVEPWCDDDCEVIQATGLSPTCTGGEADLYVDLNGTDPSVWIRPGDGQGEVRPGTYRVVAAERCERNAEEVDGADLYRVRFRNVEG